MHDHDHDHEAEQATGAVRPAHDTPTAVQLQAAAEGRPDVLGGQGLLGLQRAVGNGAATGLVQRAAEEEQERSPVLGVVGSGGSSLDEGVRGEMEARLGHDFSDVRVHTGAEADASARSVSAHAYTVGSSIVFQRGAYDPGTPAGKTLLAHELTHVVQQRHGPVDGTPTGDGVSVSDPSDRFEREAAANADRVMAQPAPVQTGTLTPSTAASTAAVQRQEEEEEVQASHDPALPPVQREAEEEEEVPS